MTCLWLFKLCKWNFISGKNFFYSFLLASWRSMTKIAGSGSIVRGTDLYQNVTNPQHCCPQFPLSLFHCWDMWPTPALCILLALGRREYRVQWGGVARLNSWTLQIHLCPQEERRQGGFILFFLLMAEVDNWWKNFSSSEEQLLPSFSPHQQIYLKLHDVVSYIMHIHTR